MNRSDSPKKQPVPFGVNGQREDLLSATPAGDNTASYSDGFPAVTMILKAAGGLPPKGQDMNQILFELSALSRWFSTGAQQTFDASFAASIGGYPAGSYVIGSDLKTIYRCTTDGNTNNPNSSTSGWVRVADDIAQLLSIGTAAKRNVGTTNNDIPDMSLFSCKKDYAGYQYFPTGMLLQWGTQTLNSSPAGTSTSTFPIAFPGACYRIVANHNDPASNVLAYPVISAPNRSSFFTNVLAINSDNFTQVQNRAVTISWLAIGY